MALKSNSKYEKVDFSKQDLSKTVITGSIFTACNFDEANLSEASLEKCTFFGSTFRGTNCYRTSFKHSKLAGTIFQPKDAYGITVTLECKTFERATVDQLWWYSFLMFAASMEPADHANSKGLTLKDRLLVAIGAERYLRLKDMFKRREI